MPVKPADFGPYFQKLREAPPMALEGRVTKVVGLVIEANGPMTSIGDICSILPHNAPPLEAEVVGFREDSLLLMPVGSMSGLTPGSRVVTLGRPAEAMVGPELLGRILDGLGRPIDNGPSLNLPNRYPLTAYPGNPLGRARILKPLDMGIRALNALLTIGLGQRVGIFAGSGVGKSTLLGMLARTTKADINVIALIGERGREVREFIEKDLGPEGLARSVVVVATSEQAPLVRMRGAAVATAIAEYFRDQSQNVILMMDSITRYAYAAREVGLSIGEPVTTRGYTPSVFARLPQLLERAGAWENMGSITGLYTVLVEGDDMNEPVADAARSILDGHLVLRRELAAKNQYPALDVLSSISRLMSDLAEPPVLAAAARFKDLLATYQKNEDMINIGAYQKGASPEIDQALALYPQLINFIKQPVGKSISLEESRETLIKLVNGPKNSGRPAAAGAELGSGVAQA